MNAIYDGTEVVQVLLEATTIYEDVIEVCYYIIVKYIKEDLLNQPFKNWQGISEAKRHHYPFEKTISGQKSTMMLLLRGDPDLIVPHGQVYL